MTLGSAIKFWLSIGCFTQEYMENITVALRFFWGVYVGFIVSLSYDFQMLETLILAGCDSWIGL